MMKILVLNCGSSSIKYQLFNMTEKLVMAKDVVEKIGLTGSFIKHTKESGEKVRFVGEILDHKTGIVAAYFSHTNTEPDDCAKRILDFS